MDMLGQNYVLKGMVQCVSHHFTVAIKNGTHWVCVDDMCDSVRNYTSCQNLLHSNPKGCFFLQYLRSLLFEVIIVCKQIEAPVKC